MNELTKILLEYSSFNHQEIELISDRIRHRELSRGDYLLKSGRIARELAFVTSGIIRVALQSETGDDITRAFIPEYHFALNFNSLNNQVASGVSFIAVTDCRLLVIVEQDLTELGNTIPHWQRFLSNIAVKVLSNKMNLLNDMMLQDAETRYLEFLKIYPGLANRIPLSTLASYLGINQSTLSRIRRNIS
ncbi:Crp/Fnr family transcriptional regulator [Chitinophaga pinensis]|uniref:Transcriptional regulator, Crp/Fnr family n=1 Tax=Chitinophaga pinensis (strain ATCC 43595 / DSM 2588 / LMG 13176 / NBRC 15968 / NCIMB 11800 / UQM 2034) TaxID=485918 RepID=A0A979G3N7_CHIPD|nr:cyclic nucleotide-binding domain-containing protein [Chitinophaga pinensis]ACU60197.1 putative transcriptional regulator, Crp/Fnr family [Chitinophaga pinensis DSM 2588]